MANKDKYKTRETRYYCVECENYFILHKSTNDREAIRRKCKICKKDCETDDTQEWWKNAGKIYSVFPDSVPEVIHYLLDDSWNESEVMATSRDVREVQSWATGIAGWKNQDSPLSFKKV